MSGAPEGMAVLPHADQPLHLQEAGQGPHGTQIAGPMNQNSFGNPTAASPPQNGESQSGLQILAAATPARASRHYQAKFLSVSKSRRARAFLDSQGLALAAQLTDKNDQQDDGTEQANTTAKTAMTPSRKERRDRHKRRNLSIGPRTSDPPEPIPEEGAQKVATAKSGSRTRRNKLRALLQTYLSEFDLNGRPMPESGNSKFAQY